MKLHRDNTASMRFMYFDSTREAVEYAEGYENPSATSRSGRVRREWYGGLTFEEATKTAREGWSEIRPEVDAVLNPVRERLSSILDYTVERGYDMVGFEPDISLYLDGEVECMVDYVPELAPANGKVFNLLVNTSFLSGVRPETVRQNGIVIVALIEAMAMLGFEVNVFAEASAQHQGKINTTTFLTRIHRAGEYIDINNIMFPLAHASWHRRIIFGCRERIRRSGEVGGTIAVTCTELCEASFVVSLAHMYLPGGDPVKWILDQLQVQGVYEGEVS